MLPSEEHQREVQKYKLILQNARDNAQTHGYDATQTRSMLHSEFSRRNPGLSAYEWQVDVAEALLLGLDCSVIAGTGAGKTSPFVMPLFIEVNKVIVIISPLNALEEDQANRFQKLGINAVAVNSETYNKKLHKEIEDGKYSAIITSPDMCLQHDAFRRIISSPAFASKICAFVIDEAHCISQWGESFRPVYAELGTLRSFVPIRVPFLVTSATLPPPVLAQVRSTIHIRRDDSYHVNLGTDRPNIAWFIHDMRGGKSDLEALTFLIPTDQDRNGDKRGLTQTMVFFDDIGLAMEARKWICNRLPSELVERVAVYHSRRSKYSKRRVLREFRLGEIKILLTTDAAGMGCDLPHIEQVVQFMVPNTLPIWMQRAGRAGRSAGISARAVLLVQPSVFQEIKPTGNDIEDSRVYRKSIEDGLREWITTEECRRDVADRYFGSVGIPRRLPTGICCDNCLSKVMPDHPLLHCPAKALPPEPPERSLSPHSDSESSSQVKNPNGKRMMVESQSVTAIAIPGRRDLHLQGARALLVEWRRNTWAEHYRRRPWGMQCLLPDAILTAIATKARLRTIDDLIAIGWSPTHAKKHGAALLQILGEYDTDYHRTHEAEKSRRNEEKKRATAERQRARKEENARAREIRAAQPKPPRPSRARISRQPLVNSSILNHPPPEITQYVVPSMHQPGEAPLTQHTHCFQPQSSLPYHSYIYPTNPYPITFNPYPLPPPTWPAYTPDIIYPPSLPPHTPTQPYPETFPPHSSC